MPARTAHLFCIIAALACTATHAVRVPDATAALEPLDTANKVMCSAAVDTALQACADQGLDITTVVLNTADDTDYNAEFDDSAGAVPPFGFLASGMPSVGVAAQGLSISHL